MDAFTENLSSSGRLSQLLHGLCGGDASGCEQDEFIVMGTGERIELSFGEGNDTSMVEGTEDARNFSVLFMFAMSVAAASAVLLLVVFDSSTFYNAAFLSLLDCISRLKAQINKVSNAISCLFRGEVYGSSGASDNRKFLKSNIKSNQEMEPNEQSGVNLAINRDQGEGETRSSDAKVSDNRDCLKENHEPNHENKSNQQTGVTSVTKEVHQEIVKAPRSEEEGRSTKGSATDVDTPLAGTEEASHQLVSIDTDATSFSLSLFTEDQLKQQGREIARNMSVLMSEFELIMKEKGYNVSQSEALTIASHRLSSLETLRLQKMSEARHYLYDSQQRSIDRSLSDRQHLEKLDVMEQEKEWFSKLKDARRDCIQAICPAIQRSFIAVSLSYAAYNLYVCRHSLSLDYALGLVYRAAKTAGIHRNDAVTEDAASPINMGGASWLAYPIVLFFSRFWATVLIPLVSLLFFATLQFVLPFMILQFLKTASVVVLLVWASRIPWKAICVAQLLFWILAQIWTRAVFEHAQRQLNKGGTCPTSHEVNKHVSRLDQTTRSIYWSAYLLNFSIMLVSAS